MVGWDIVLAIPSNANIAQRSLPTEEDCSTGGSYSNQFPTLDLLSVEQVCFV
jgi:hypothetical protein